MTVFEYFWNQKNKFVDLLWHRETKRVNELAVLKLRYIIILPTQERKYETKTFNENFAKKVRTCRLPFPETWSLNSLTSSVPGPHDWHCVAEGPGENQNEKWFDWSHEYNLLSSKKAKSRFGRWNLLSVNGNFIFNIKYIGCCVTMY
jgi:hypothetical protein